MDDVAIRAEGLGKRYALGGGDAGKRSLREDVVRTLMPFLSRRGAIAEESAGVPFWALKDLSFEIKQGEAVGIIGRNGSGKSTLLKILSQITAPTEGRVMVAGRLGALLEVGTGFHPELTGRQNIFLNGIMLGMGDAEVARKLEEIVDFAGVREFIDVPVKRFSSGMHVRLAFAVAAHLDADILVLDEVLSVGDSEFQRKSLKKVGEAARNGCTVLIVSHDMEVVQRSCQRGLLLEQGRILMDRPMADVVTRYMDMGVQRAAERTWEDDELAPRFLDRSMRLLGVRALEESGAVSEFFDVTEPMVIEVEYRVATRRHRVVVQLWVRNRAGQIAFVTMDNVPARSEPQREGMHRARCHIPGNFLTEGTMRIGVLLQSRTVSDEQIRRDDVLTLTIRDEYRQGSVRGDWQREWPDVLVRPRLVWEYLDEQSRRQLENPEADLLAASMGGTR